MKDCHTGKSNYGLNLSIIFMFLTIYGVEKSQCDSSKDNFSLRNSLLISPLLPQTGKDFAQTSRTSFLKC